MAYKIDISKKYRVTNSGIAKGKNASGDIIGYYKSEVTKSTYPVSIGKCIEVLNEYMKYAFIANDREKTDYDNTEAKAFLDALYFQYSYVKGQPYENICKAFKQVLLEGAVHINSTLTRYFIDDISENDKDMMLWAVSHPIEFWGGMKDLENIRLGNTDTSNSSIFGIEIKKLGMWAALVASVVFLIKGIKK